MNIYEKLQKARVELQNTGLKKSGYNTFAKFDYFELKDFLPKVNEIFLELKLFSKFDLLENEGVLTIINIENPEEKETFATPKGSIESISKGQNELQKIGSTHTYLKRYCYYNALEIIVNDDYEASITNDKKENKAQQPPKNSQEKKQHKKELSEDEKRQIAINTIKSLNEKYNDVIGNYLEVRGAKEIEKLNNDEVFELYNKLKNKEKEAA